MIADLLDKGVVRVSNGVQTLSKNIQGCVILNSLKTSDKTQIKRKILKTPELKKQHEGNKIYSKSLRLF
jgi:hypothetical protein